MHVTTARDLPDGAHPSRDHRPGGRHVAGAARAGASRSASAAARRSTSTSSATAGRRPTCGWRCSRRRSRSCARLWEGGQRSHYGRALRGRERARSTTLPETPPPVLVSGFGPEGDRARRARRRRLLHRRRPTRTPSSRFRARAAATGSSQGGDEGLLRPGRGRVRQDRAPRCGRTRGCPASWPRSSASPRTSSRPPGVTRR